MGRTPQYSNLLPPRIIVVENCTETEKTYLEANNYEYVDKSKKVMKKKSFFRRIFG